MRNNDEARLAVAFVNYMRYAYPEVTVWCVRNEYAQNEIQGKIFKDRGIVPGVHDYGLLGKPFGFATIELKRENKKPEYSLKQKEYADAVANAGFKSACCNSGSSIMAALLDFGLPKTRYRFPPLVSSATNLKGQYITMISHGLDIPLPRGFEAVHNPYAALVRGLE